MKKVILVMLSLMLCLVSHEVINAAEPRQNVAKALAACAVSGQNSEPVISLIPAKPVYDFRPHDDPSSRDGQVSAWISPEQGSLSRSRLGLIESYYGNRLASSVKNSQLSESSRVLNSFIPVSNAVDSANRGCLLLQQTLENLTPCKEVVGLPKPISLNYAAQEKVICGGALMYMIRNNRAIKALDLKAEQPYFLNEFKDDLEAYLHSIVDLTFYMYAEAINKAQPFTDGSFVVLDEGCKLWNFLMYYCRVRNTDLKGTSQDKQMPGTLNHYACCRASSHFQYAQNYKGNDINPRHYGIDIRFEKGSDHECSSITEMPHILFGLVGITSNETPVLFIKLEDAGVKLSWEWVMHSFGFIGSKARKAQANYTPDSDARKRLKYYFGSDDGYGKQKERTSLHFLDSCKHIIKYAQCPQWVMGNGCPTIVTTGLVPDVCTQEVSQSLANDLKTLKKKGINELARLIDNKPAHWTEKMHKAFVEFYERDAVLLDYPGVRTGDEVIIGKAEYESGPFYFWMLRALQKKDIPGMRPLLTDLAWVCEQMYKNERDICRCEQEITSRNACIGRMCKYKPYLLNRELAKKMQRDDADSLNKQELLVERRKQLETMIAQLESSLQTF